ncbi:glyoxalase superfamily protein [Rhizobium terrae]|uniref:glyoxalase superfamily protein n=1 Tax=Rhizobium terrae TaxID=2171756 RepID=UPI001D004618|nr:glyoxalase superfamily protein [Rhizobium terrae]
MRDFRDAKAMAKTLREALHAKSFTLTNSESQELIARILGYRDWCQATRGIDPFADIRN